MKADFQMEELSQPKYTRLSTNYLYSSSVFGEN